MPTVGATAIAILLLSPYNPIPSVRREGANTSMATVELATVNAPKGAPCSVLIMANINSVPAAKYPPKNMKNRKKHHSKTFFLGYESTRKPLSGRVKVAVMVYPINTSPIISFVAPNSSLRYSGNSGVNK